MVVVAGDDPRPDALVAAWVDAVAARRDLLQDALGWLARRLDRPAGELGPSFGRKTPFERRRVPRSVPAGRDRRRGGLPVAAGATGRRGQAAGAGGQDSARRSPACDGDAAGERVVGALFTLVPQGGAPGLLLVQPRAAHDPTAWIAAAAASLARLAEAEPRLPLLVAIEPEALEPCSTRMLPSRAPGR